MRRQILSAPMIGGMAGFDTSEECDVVELTDGTVYMNARSGSGTTRSALMAGTGGRR